MPSTESYKREGAFLVTEEIEKNYLGHVDSGADWRQLLFWLGKSYVEP